MLRFREEGYKTFTIAPEAGKTYQSKKGYPCKSDVDIDSIKADVRVVDVNFSLSVLTTVLRSTFTKTVEDFN